MKQEESHTTGIVFLKSAAKHFTEYKILGEKTLTQLSEAQLRFQPNTTTNSIAIIVQHLHGNMLSRWTSFLTEDGEKEWRNRDAEFEVQSDSKEALLRMWNDGWNVLFNTLTSLNEHDLLKNITIRRQPHTVLDAINRQLAHYSYHVGQIVFIGKWLLAEIWKTLSIPKGGSQQFNDALN